MLPLGRFLQLNLIKSCTRLLSTQINHNSSKICASPLVLQKLANNPWIWQINDKIITPTIVNNKRILDLPNDLKWVPIIDAPKAKLEIDAPSPKNVPEIEAARLIVIRRKKMKKHKLRKLRKRMKFEWAKIRQRRELKKEKEFQAGLIKQCKEAEEFSAEKYVQERIDKLNEIIVPRYWKGRKLPEWLVREKMGLPPKSTVQK